MILKLHTHQAKTLQDLRAFTVGNGSFEFEPISHHEALQLIETTLRSFHYADLRKPDKGVVRAYLLKVTGLSRAQLTRRIAQFRDSGQVRDRRGRPGKPYPRRYTEADIRLLAETDRLHERLSGPAIRHICKRQYEQFGEARYQRLARISISHLYVLRRRRTYRRLIHAYQPTRSVKMPGIAARRKPRPEGRPGFLRIDTVHQGDLRELYGCEPIKGVYHLNAVDAVTQWEALFAVPALALRFVQPALEEMVLDTFPFEILGFHSDGGSEFINRATAALMARLQIDFTRSRPRHCNDNGLVESKNASIVRKQFGYGHIPVRFHADINRFTVGVLSEHLNFHRPCWYAEQKIDPKGRIRQHYDPNRLMTPYEKFRSLPEAESYLRPGVTLTQLEALSRKRNDNDSARRVLRERKKLFGPILASFQEES